VLNKTSHLVFYDDLMEADKSPEVLQSIADFIGIGGKLTEEDLKQIKDMTSKEAIEKLAQEGARPYLRERGRERGRAFVCLR
jgi:hypothetical protein